MCWLAQTNDIHRSHCSLWSVLWTVTLDSCERIMRLAEWKLKTYHRFNLSITARRWVTIPTCQVGTVLEIKSDSTLLPFCCILKCKWLTFSQSHCDSESFLRHLELELLPQMLTGTEAPLTDENTSEMTTSCAEFPAPCTADWVICVLCTLLLISVCLCLLTKMTLGRYYALTCFEAVVVWMWNAIGSCIWILGSRLMLLSGKLWNL